MIRPIQSPAERVARMHLAGRLPIVLRGRTWALRDLRIVLECVAAATCRTHASQLICERLNWRQPSGWLKERACRDVLLRLAQLRLVRLPKPLRVSTATRRPRLVHRALVAELDLKTPITTFPRSLRFELAKGNQAEKLWN